MSVRSRLSWMVSGPARIDELERAVRTLQEQLDVLQRNQDRQLDDIRTAVSAALDDVAASADTRSDG